jgi:hypothetical protein
LICLPLYRCFLYFLDDAVGQFQELDKLDGNDTSIGSPLTVSGNVALSPSDDETKLFCSTGNALAYIDYEDASTTPIADVSGIEVMTVNV